MTISLLLQALIQRLEKYLTMDINEISINKEKEVYITRGSKHELITDEDLDSETLFLLCKHLANARDMEFNEYTPVLSCSIPNTNFRINALHPSVTISGNIAISIRIPSLTKFKIQNFTLETKHDEFKTHEEILRLIENKKNVLVSGGTASGKTSFVNTLLESIPKEERIITIEDSAELKIDNPNKVQIMVGRTRSKIFNYESALNNAMRMSPQRIILGEIDTRNTSLFLRLANTGHDGMISTLHANSAKEAFFAIAMNIKIGSGTDISDKALIDYFSSGIDYVIQIKRVGHERKITDILNVKRDFKKFMEM